MVRLRIRNATISIHLVGFVRFDLVSKLRSTKLLQKEGKLDTNTNLAGILRRYQYQYKFYNSAKQYEAKRSKYI